MGWVSRQISGGREGGREGSWGKGWGWDWDWGWGCAMAVGFWEGASEALAETRVGVEDGGAVGQVVRAVAEYGCGEGVEEGRAGGWGDARFARGEARTYAAQYANLYMVRLASMRPGLVARVRQACPGVPVRELNAVGDKGPDEDGVVGDGSGECVVVGTVYKEMKLRFTILDEYSKERGGKSTRSLGDAHLARYTSDDDACVVEDMTGRTAVVAAAGGGPGPGAGRGMSAGPLDVQALATGSVVAVRGRVNAAGEFEVAQCWLPGPAPLPRALGRGARQGKLVCLVSGLGFGGAGDTPEAGLRRSLLVDWLTGHLGGPHEVARAAQVVRVVVVGNSVDAEEAAEGGGEAPVRKENAGAGGVPAKAGHPARELDMMLTQLCASAPVDIMPGVTDPASFALPQEPLHPCLFPSTARCTVAADGSPALHLCPNPHEFELDGVRFLGTSGQNVDDLYKYVSHTEDRVELMESTMRARHLCPTAPDTLACYPYTRMDPFVIKESPHVYFVGNQPAFGTALLKHDEGSGETRLVALPKFAATGEAVLVDLETLDARTVSFDV